jgi:hypothetical protein
MTINIADLKLSSHRRDVRAGRVTGLDQGGFHHPLSPAGWTNGAPQKNGWVGTFPGFEQRSKTKQE